jgi:hypothetical protein
VQQQERSMNMKHKLFECHYEIKKKDITDSPIKKHSEKVSALNEDNANDEALKEVQRIFPISAYNITLIKTEETKPNSMIEKLDLWHKG